MALPTSGSGKSCTSTRAGALAGCHSRPLLARFPTTSFSSSCRPRRPARPSRDAPGLGQSLRYGTGRPGRDAGSLVVLGGGLQRVAELVQQPQHRTRRHREASAPPDRRPGASRTSTSSAATTSGCPGFGMHQLVEGFEQTGLLVDQRLVTTARRSQTNRRLDPGDHFRLGLDHRVAAHPRRGRHRRLIDDNQPAISVDTKNKEGTDRRLRQRRHRMVARRPTRTSERARLR